MSRSLPALETLAQGFQHAEAPTVVGDELWFSDVAGGGVHSFSGDAGVAVRIPHRRGVGGMVAHSDGGVIVTGRNVAWKSGDATVVLLEGADGESFSDLCVDRAGGLLVGGLFFDRADGGSVQAPGRLHHVDAQQRAGAIVGATTDLPNGVAYSPDGRWLYHSDTTAGIVWRYAVDGNTLMQRTAWVDVGTRWPDGIAVGEDSSVWIALAHGSAVAGWNADGSVIGEIPMTNVMPTSVSFGGPELAALYVTSAALGLESDGGLHRCELGISGVPLQLATVRGPGPMAAHDSMSTTLDASSGVDR